MNPNRWQSTQTVVVIGVKDGQLTHNPDDVQRFTTLVAARLVFPDLTPDLPGYRFTEALSSPDTDEMLFRTRTLAGEADAREP